MAKELLPDALWARIAPLLPATGAAPAGGLRPAGAAGCYLGVVIERVPAAPAAPAAPAGASALWATAHASAILGT